MNLRICVLYNNSAISSDCMMSNVWLMLANWVESNYNGCLISLGSTVLTFCWTDWLRTIWCPSARMDRHPANFLTEQLPSGVETCYCLKGRGSLGIRKWREVWRFVNSRSGMWCFLPIEIWRCLAGYSIPEVPRKVIIMTTSGENYTVTRCHIAEEWDLYAFVCELGISMFIR